MEKDYTNVYHLMEENFWWFKGRRNLILKFLKKTSKDSKILDIGCSSGILLSEIRRNGFKNLNGIDIDKKSVDLSKEKDLDVEITDAKIFESKNKFKILIASDILEHIDDDKTALKNWNNLLENNGKLILFVPAFMFLWRKHDEVNKHFRRYHKKELIEKLKSSGFKIKKFSYWNFISFLPLLIKKNEHNLENISPSLNKILFNYIKFENFIVDKLKIPMGVSILIVAEKAPKETN